MATVKKRCCDRCKKDITEAKWRGVLKSPRKFKLKVIHANYNEYEYEFDLCAGCMGEVKRILEGKEDG